ncbi:MAG: hypothetical protein SGPRY_010597 [Prymnesium sp.]
MPPTKPEVEMKPSEGEGVKTEGDETAAEAVEAEKAAKAREERLATEREAERLRAEAAEAAREKERARAEAEATERERRRQMNNRVARAGTAFAALMEDDDDDDDESSEEEQPPPPPPSKGVNQAKGVNQTRGVNPSQKGQKQSPVARVSENGKSPSHVVSSPPSAPPTPSPPPPRVWWGSEEHDPAQCVPLKLSTASYSKAGDAHIHANEDRFTILTDLNTELAKRPSSAEELDDDAPPGSTVRYPPSNSFFAVYDGHGGVGCCTYASSKLHLHLNADAELWRTHPSKALLAAFSKAESELRHSYDSTPDSKAADKSGTCALVALLRGSRLYIAGLGDCRALLVRSESHPHPFQQLTVDQRATESGEQARILKAGGQISNGRVWGALIPSRTLGDFPWKDRGPGLSSIPEISTFEISAEDKYLIMGSDGVFDVLTNRTIAKIAGKMSSAAGKVSNELVKELRKRPGTDDVTLLVIQLGH